MRKKNGICNCSTSTQIEKSHTRKPIVKHIWPSCMFVFMYVYAFACVRMEICKSKLEQHVHVHVHAQ